MWYPINEYCEMLSVSDKTIRRRVKNGELKHKYEMIYNESSKTASKTLFIWHFEKSELSENINVITLDELLQTDFTETHYIVNKLVPVGLTIMSAKPKMGKSWMCLRLAVEVSQGGHFIGECTKSKTLYIALEDSRSRLFKRLATISFLDQNALFQNLHFATAVPPMSGSLLMYLSELIKRDDYKFIIIDTFARVKEQINARTNAYLADYQVTAEVQQFAFKHNIGVLLVHHNRKTDLGYASLDDVSGTMGITAAADSIIILRSNPKSKKKTLLVTGRDFEEYSTQFTHDGANFEFDAIDFQTALF